MLYSYKIVYNEGYGSCRLARHTHGANPFSRPCEINDTQPETKEPQRESAFTR
jgi:hypothetical protein